MSIVNIFQAYAAAFEEFYEDGGTTRFDRYFTEDAVYLPGDGNEYSGREQIYSYFAEAINGLDKKFDTRELTLTAGPTVSGNQVEISWTAAYTKAELPDFVIHGREVATFTDNAISHLEDILDETSAQHMQDWLASHGEQLG